MERNGTLLAGPILRVAAGAGLLLLTAAVVLTVGGAGVLGTLGSILGTTDTHASGGDARAESRDSRRFAAIVAVPVAKARRPAGRRARGRPSPPAGRPGDRGAPPAVRPPGAPAPGPPPGAPVPGPGPGVPPAPPPAAGPVVDTIDRTTDQLAEQAPPAAKPLVDPVQQLVDQAAGACGELPVCP